MGRTGGAVGPSSPNARVGLAKGTAVVKVVNAIGKKHSAHKVEKWGLAAPSSRPGGEGDGGSPSGSGEGALLNTTASRGSNGDGVGVAAGNGGGGGQWGGNLSDKGTASDPRCAEDERDTIETTGARGGLASAQSGEGDFAGRTAGGGGVAGVAAETAADAGGENAELVPTSGDIGFAEEEEDSTWCIPEVAAPKAVWEGHIGPVARIGSCSQPPCFFSLGEVCMHRGLTHSSHDRKSDFPFLFPVS